MVSVLDELRLGLWLMDTCVPSGSKADTEPRLALSGRDGLLEDMEGDGDMVEDKESACDATGLAIGTLRCAHLDRFWASGLISGLCASKFVHVGLRVCKEEEKMQ